MSECGIRTPQPVTIELDLVDDQMKTQGEEKMATGFEAGVCKFMLEGGDPPNLCKLMKDSIQESNLCTLMHEDSTERNNAFCGSSASPPSEGFASGVGALVFGNAAGGNSPHEENTRMDVAVEVQNGSSPVTAEQTIQENVGYRKSPVWSHSSNEPLLPPLTGTDEVTTVSNSMISLSKSPHWSPPSLELAVANDEEMVSSTCAVSEVVHSPPSLDMALNPSETSEGELNERASDIEGEMRDCHVALERVELPLGSNVVE